MVTRIDLYRQATIFDVTDITGSELEALSTGSNADYLHIHDLGSMTGTISIVHNDTTGIQGGASNDYYHLTGAQATDLTDGGETILHYHAGSNITYNNTTSGLTASDVQSAIDEVSGSIVAAVAFGWREVTKLGAPLTAGTALTVPNSRTYTLSSGFLDVYSNGQLLTLNADVGGGTNGDWDEVTGSTVQFNQTWGTTTVITFVYNPHRT